MQYNLLIVDDMPIIVDGLADMFADEISMELEIFRAYSVIEAVALLKQNRIDVVLTDIKMPVMTGIDLLKEIKAQWPQCKVILLTSYNEFEYAKTAVSLGGFDYILKTEGDERIIASVEKALETIRNEMEMGELLVKAREQYNQAKPILQREYLCELMDGRRSPAEIRKERFMQLEIDLNAEAPVFLLLLRLDEGYESLSYTERVRQLYSVRNIMEDSMKSLVKSTPVFYGRTDPIWFMQPNDAAGTDKDGWERVFRFIYGNLETVQGLCSSFLKLKVSFMISSKPVEWDEIAGAYSTMETLFKSGIYLNSEVLTTDAGMGNIKKNSSAADSENREKLKSFRLNRFAVMEEFLENGKAEDFFGLFSELSLLIKEYHEDAYIKLEVYHYLSTMLLSFLNRWNMLSRIRDKVDFHKLKTFDEQCGWNAYEAFFSNVFRLIFEGRKNEQEEQTNKVVLEIQDYIANHLQDDISLTKLGELVHLNSSYLSRLYKQITGIGLSEYIAEQRIQRAKELLARRDLKIHHIASMLGYHSGIAFARFFKNYMSVTPQEYRDMNR